MEAVSRVRRRRNRSRRGGGLRIGRSFALGPDAALLLENLALEGLDVSNVRETVGSGLARGRDDPDVAEAKHPAQPRDHRLHVGDRGEQRVGLPSPDETIGPEHAPVRHVILGRPPGDDVVDDPRDPTEEECQPHELEPAVDESGHTARAVALQPGRDQCADDHEDRPLRVAERCDPMLRRRPDDGLAGDQPLIQVRHACNPQCSREIDSVARRQSGPAGGARSTPRQALEQGPALAWFPPWPASRARCRSSSASAAGSDRSPERPKAPAHRAPSRPGGG